MREFDESDCNDFMQRADVKRWCPELAHVPADKLHLLSLNSTQELVSWGVELGITYPFPLGNPLKWTRRKQESVDN